MFSPATSQSGRFPGLLLGPTAPDVGGDAFQASAGNLSGWGGVATDRIALIITALAPATSSSEATLLCDDNSETDDIVDSCSEDLRREEKPHEDLRAFLPPGAPGGGGGFRPPQDALPLPISPCTLDMSTDASTASCRSPRGSMFCSVCKQRGATCGP